MAENIILFLLAVKLDPEGLVGLFRCTVLAKNIRTDYFFPFFRLFHITFYFQQNFEYSEISI